MKYLNLGILAHVDAGKTSLTERLLYAAGAIDRIGSVDHGNTQTDSLHLERQRGITIKSAIASFGVKDTRVNLIDTPGHPDFIAEVERVLAVLDGVVLVVSAVEGVQPQTRILMRALQRLRIPTVIFVNKIDRVGARYQNLLDDLTAKLALKVSPMGEVENIGVPTAGFRLSKKTPKEDTIPVFFGSAITGSGIPELLTALPRLFAASNNFGAELSGVVFKIERGSRGEKIVYVRIFSGSIKVRGKFSLGKITALKNAGLKQVLRLGAGEIGKAWGLEKAKVGDVLGDAKSAESAFAPPTLEAAVAAKDVSQMPALHAALQQLAEQDPLINFRQSNQKLYLSLYGEVQKEVIGSTLSMDYGIEVVFERTKPICVERLIGIGHAAQLLQSESNPTSATVGLSVEPGKPGSGLVFKIEALPRNLPLHIYKNKDNFAEHMTRYIAAALKDGLHSLEVTDCIVTMTECNYYAGDGPSKPISDTPKTTAADYRKLTPIVLHEALLRAKTCICKPICKFVLEVPSGALSATLKALAVVHAVPVEVNTQRRNYIVQGDIPASYVHDLQQRLPDITGGEGFLEYEFDRYEA